jgi:hypothetical protein
MTFLAPAAGLIGAAVGVPLLVALYLLKLRRKPLKVSSTLLWEQAVQDLQANVPLRWLKWSWLLLVQMGALGCLLIALARPAVPGTAGVAARTILVIDCSASMSARDGDGGPLGEQRTRLEEAKRDALALVEQMRRASGLRAEGMVVAMGATTRVVRGFTSDTRELRDAIDAIGPTDQPANLDEVVQIASAAALAGTDSEREGPRTALVVFSDGSLAPCRERLPGSVDLRLVRVGPDPTDASRTLPDNLGIVAIGARRDTDNPGLALVFVRVTNAGSSAAETTLTCSADGAPAGLLPLSVPAATCGADGAVTPGEAAGTLELDRPAGGLLVVNIPRADLLDADNTAATVLRPVSKPRILVVGPNDSNDPYASARGVFGIDRFLLGALRDLEPGEVRPMDAASYRQGAKTFGNYDLIVFDRVEPISLPLVPTISIGAGVPIAGLTIVPLPADRVPDAATRFISWKRTSPILKNAALDAVLVSPPMRMTIVEGGTGATDQPERPVVTPLAFGTGGPLIALALEPGVRGVKRLALAFDLVRTNWGQDVSFPVFVSSAVDYLTGRGEAAAGRSQTTAEPMAVAAAPGATRIRVSGAEEFAADVPTAKDGAGASVSLGLPRRAGVYQCEGAAPEFDRIAANLVDARESALGTERSISVGGRNSRAGADHAGESPKREVWHWFIIGAGALLTIEWFMYAWKAKP